MPYGISDLGQCNDSGTEMSPEDTYKSVPRESQYPNFNLGLTKPPNYDIQD